MSNSAKTWSAVGIVVVAIIIVGAVWHSASSAPAAVKPAQVPVAASPQPAPAPVAVDSSNAGIDQDAASFDSQMSGLNSDSATMNQSASAN